MCGLHFVLLTVYYVPLIVHLLKMSLLFKISPIILNICEPDSAIYIGITGL